MASRGKRGAPEDDDENAGAGAGSKRSKSAISAGSSNTVSFVEKTFACTICTEVMEHPVTTPCGHSFCSACLQESMTSPIGKNCPTCRGNVPSLPMRNKQVADAVDKYLKALPAGQRSTQLDRRLCLAARTGRPNRVDELLKMGGRPNAKSTYTVKGEQFTASALSQTVYCGPSTGPECIAHAECCLHLLNAGAEANGEDLYNACFDSKFDTGPKWADVASAMLDREDIDTSDVNDEGITCLSLAVSRGWEALAIRMLERGAAVNVPCGGDPSKSCIAQAAEKGMHLLVKAMLDRGAVVASGDPHVAACIVKSWELTHPFQVKGKYSMG